MINANKTLIVIAGPTAIGKTAIAIRIAQKFQTEIISADSRQFFIEMNIGTAKPSHEELSQIKHHFISSHRITDNFNVGDFEKEGLSTIASIFKNQDVALLVGGSGLYVNAICNGFDDFPDTPPELRDILNLRYQTEGITTLQKQLELLDFDYYNKVDINNPQRIIRALEICLSTGLPYSTYRTHQRKVRPFDIIKIGLNTDRESLYNRINRRVDLMIKEGLVEEVRLLSRYRKLNSLNTVGYSELFEYFDGTISLEGAINKIKQNSRRFAKRQLTWFRRDQEFNWFEPDQFETILQFISERINSKTNPV